MNSIGVNINYTLQKNSKTGSLLKPDQYQILYETPDNSRSLSLPHEDLFVLLMILKSLTIQLSIILNYCFQQFCENPCSK